jgi:hypothetical protein
MEFDHKLSLSSSISISLNYLRKGIFREYFFYTDLGVDLNEILEDLLGLISTCFSSKCFVFPLANLRSWSLIS